VISDFGQASQATERIATAEMCGDPRYMPPEAWGDAENAWCHGVGSKPADVWMLGSTLFEILSGGSLPFLSHKHVSLQQFRAAWATVQNFASDYRHRVKTGEPLWSSTNKLGVQRRSTEALDCCASMLMKSPTLRFSCAQITAHAWFKQGGAQTAMSHSERLADEARKRILNNVASAAHEDKTVLGTPLTFEERKTSDVMTNPDDLASSDMNPMDQVPQNSEADSEVLPQVPEMSPAAWLGTEQRERARPKKGFQNKAVPRKGSGGSPKHGTSGAVAKESEQVTSQKSTTSQSSSTSGQEICTGTPISEDLVLQLRDITDLSIEQSTQLLASHQGNLEKAVRAHAESAGTKSGSKIKIEKNCLPPDAPPPPPSPPPPPPVPASSEQADGETHGIQGASQADANTSGPDSMGREGSTEHRCPWQKYTEPGSGRIWFWNSETEDTFFEDEPAPWCLYVTTSGRQWWWHESGQKPWFYDDEADH